MRVLGLRDVEYVRDHLRSGDQNAGSGLRLQAHQWALSTFLCPASGPEGEKGNGEPACSFSSAPAQGTELTQTRFSQVGSSHFIGL